MELNKEEIKEKTYQITIGHEEQYVQIKISSLEDDQKSSMIQIIDVSKDIMYDKEKAHNELLNLINATVSHEMRNPLNSIHSQNIENKALYEELEELIKDDNIDTDVFK